MRSFALATQWVEFLKLLHTAFLRDSELTRSGTRGSTGCWPARSCHSRQSRQSRLELVSAQRRLPDRACMTKSVINNNKRLGSPVLCARETTRAELRAASPTARKFAFEATLSRSRLCAVLCN